MNFYKSVSWWHQQRDKKVVELYKSGMPIWQIVEETFYSDTMIYMILKRWGVPLRARS